MPPARYTRRHAFLVCPWVRERCSRCDTERCISRGATVGAHVRVPSAPLMRLHTACACALSGSGWKWRCRRMHLAFSRSPSTQRGRSDPLCRRALSSVFRSVKSAQSRKTKMFHLRRDIPSRNYFARLTILMLNSCFEERYRENVG